MSIKHLYFIKHFVGNQKKKRKNLTQSLPCYNLKPNKQESLNKSNQSFFFVIFQNHKPKTIKGLMKSICAQQLSQAKLCRIPLELSMRIFLRFWHKNSFGIDSKNLIQDFDLGSCPRSI